MENFEGFVFNNYVVKTQQILIEILNTIEFFQYIIFSSILLLIVIIAFSYRLYNIVNRIDNQYYVAEYNISSSGIRYKQHNPFKFRDAILFTVIGGLINIGGIGKFGIPTKGVLLKKQGYSTSTSLASIAMDTTFDLIFSVLVLIISIIYIPSFPSFGVENVFDARIILISLTIIIFLIIKYRNKKSFFISLNAIKKIDYRNAFGLFGITLIAWLLSSISYFFIIKSTNENVDILTVFIFFSFSVVVGFISPVSGGIGIREGILTFLTTTINIAPGKGLLIAIIYRILSLAVLLLLLAILTFKESCLRIKIYFNKRIKK